MSCPEQVSVSPPIAVTRRYTDALQPTTTEGQALANSFGAKFVETSAKDKLNVEEPFFQLVKEIRKYNRQVQGISGVSRGSGMSGNGQMGKMEVEADEAAGGCCKCVVM